MLVYIITNNKIKIDKYNHNTEKKISLKVQDLSLKYIFKKWFNR